MYYVLLQIMFLLQYNFEIYVFIAYRPSTYLEKIALLQSREIFELIETQ